MGTQRREPEQLEALSSPETWAWSSSSYWARGRWVNITDPHVKRKGGASSPIPEVECPGLPTRRHMEMGHPSQSHRDTWRWGVLVKPLRDTQKWGIMADPLGDTPRKGVKHKNLRS